MKNMLTRTILLVLLVAILPSCEREHLSCKFRSQGTARFGVMVPLISVVGFFISLRWYRSVPKRSLSFFINGDFACMVPSDLSFTNSSFRSSGTACGS